MAIVFACLMLTIAAQESIRVNYHGGKPTICDFVSAFLSASVGDDDGCVDESLNAMQHSWELYQKGKPLPEGTKITVDSKHGYVVYEWTNNEHSLQIEMCYWNESDLKHKLFACSVKAFENGVYHPGQFDGLEFYRYTNATKKMVQTEDVGFEVKFYANDASVSYDLPRAGKDITANYWYSNGKKVQKTQKWQGRRFSR